MKESAFSNFLVFLYDYSDLRLVTIEFQSIFHFDFVNFPGKFENFLGSENFREIVTLIGNRWHCFRIELSAAHLVCVAE